LTFNATAGIPYRLWIRGKADVDSPYNDSVFVQFSGSVDSSGAPTFRISTTDATTVNLEDCLSCGLQGWGWQDNGWGAGVFGPLIYFSTTGQQTLRVQVREDGMSIDQIVLSPILFLATSPGALKNDSTFLSKTSTAVVPRVITITPNSGPTGGQMPVVITGSGFASAATISFGGVVVPAAQVTSDTSINATTPAHVEGNVDVRVTNPDSQSGALVDGYKFVSPAPTVRMITPNGGESLVVGSSYSITWSISGSGITQQEVQLSLDSGATWTSIFSSVPATSTSVNWQVPKSLTRTARIKIRSSTTAGVVVEDTSDHDFSILNRSRK
jgi:IPT/TIG domain-containing protein